MMTATLACISGFQEFGHRFEDLPLPPHLPFVKHAFKSLQECIILHVFLLAPVADLGVGGRQIVVNAVDLKRPVVPPLSLFNFNLPAHYNLYSYIIHKQSIICLKSYCSIPMFSAGRPLSTHAFLAKILSIFPVTPIRCLWAKNIPNLFSLILILDFRNLSSRFSFLLAFFSRAAGTPSMGSCLSMSIPDRASFHRRKSTIFGRGSSVEGRAACWWWESWYSPFNLFPVTDKHRGCETSSKWTMAFWNLLWLCFQVRGLVPSECAWFLASSPEWPRSLLFSSFFQQCSSYSFVSFLARSSEDRRAHTSSGKFHSLPTCWVDLSSSSSETACEWCLQS